MKTIELDMNITPEQAHAEYGELPESASKAKVDAYWRRYSRLKEGVNTPVTYVETADGKANIVPRVQTPAPAPKPPVTPAKEPPWKTPIKVTRPPAARSKPTGRTPGIPRENAKAIADRINRALDLLGYGAPGRGIPAPHGAITYLQTRAGFCSSDYQASIRSKEPIIYPHVLAKLTEKIGICRDYMLTGDGAMFAPSAHRYPGKAGISIQQKFIRMTAEKQKEIIRTEPDRIAASIPFQGDPRDCAFTTLPIARRTFRVSTLTQQLTSAIV